MSRTDNSDTDLRIGLVGAGRTGLAFGRACERLEGCRLTAVCDSKPERAAGIAGAKPFQEIADLLEFPEIDALVVATSVNHRGGIALRALEHGLSVLVEGPISEDESVVQEIATVVAKSQGKLVCGVSRPMRLTERARKLKELTDGAFGRPHRMQWTLTDRFCPEIFVSGPDEEEAMAQGALTLELVEELDLLLWLLGEPEGVEASRCLGKHHDAEVEDEVFFRFAWEDGATGSVISSSGEIPGVDRLEMMGDRGLLVSERGLPIQWNRTETSVEEFSRSSEERGNELPLWNIEIAVEDSDLECLLEAVVLDFSEGISFGSKAITGPQDELILLRLLKQIARLVGNR